MEWLGRFKLLFALTYAGFLGNIAVIYYLSRGLSYGEKSRNGRCRAGFLSV